MTTLEQRIRDAEGELFSGLGVEVEQSVLALAGTGQRVRLLSHGSGPPVVLLHGVSRSAAAWAPLFPLLTGCRERIDPGRARRDPYPDDVHLGVG